MNITLLSEFRIYREGLEKEISNYMFVDSVVSHSNIEHAMSSVEKSQPDCFLLDLAVNNSGKLLYWLSEQHKAIPVMVLTLDDKTDLLPICVQSGVQAYMTREDSLAELKKCLEAIHRGEKYYSLHASEVMIFNADKESTRIEIKGKVQQLTDRQSQIINLMETGMSNKEISKTLNIEVATVKNHVHQILKKLDAQSRGQAAAIYRQTQPQSAIA